MDRLFTLPVFPPSWTVTSIRRERSNISWLYRQGKKGLLYLGGILYEWMEMVICRNIHVLSSLFLAIYVE